MHLGLSGDQVIINNDVIKICKTNQQRFLKNVAKQSNFHNQFLRAVPIIEQGCNNGENFIKMPLLQCPNAVSWVSTASAYDLSLTTDLLLAYIYDNIKSSKAAYFNYDPWLEKLNDLKSKINDAELKEIIDYIKTIKFNSKFYYGKYHGDLTLSNMFISKQYGSVSIDLIDFLDCFIHSPINDLVKLRQDTRHIYTLQLLGNTPVDEVRVLIALRYMDNRVQAMLDANHNLSEFYTPFQIVNLLRIVPYNTDKHIFMYLKREIKGLFNELHTNHALRGEINKI